MHGTTDKFEQSIRKLIDEALERLRSWRQRRSEADNQIKLLESKITGYQTTLKDHWESVDLKNKKEHQNNRT